MALLAYELHSFVVSLLIIVHVLTVRCNIIHKCRVIAIVSLMSCSCGLAGISDLLYCN